MATAYFPSKQDKEKAQQIAQMVEDGTKAQPPASTQQKRNECDCCHALTILRYYHRNYGWCCEDCSHLPTICTTRADKVHQGRRHIMPALLTHPAVALQPPQDARSADSDEALIQGAVFRLGLQQDARHAKEAGNWVAERVVIIRAQRGPESVAREERWHDACKASEAKRGNVMTMPWKEAA